MKIKLWKEFLIVCVSTLCIITMVKMSEVSKGVGKTFEGYVSALIMKSDGVSIGIVESEESGNNAIEIVKHIYIESSGVNNIKSVEVENEISYEEITCNKEEILTKEEVSNKIINYNDNSKDSLVEFLVEKEVLEEPVPITLKTEEVAFNNSSEENVQLYKEVFLDNSLNTPITGILTSTFGEQRTGYAHKGIDLAANLGTPIEAALDGSVYFSGISGSYGNVVMIDHGDNIGTVYAHCNVLKVTSGERVTKGQTIAEVGSTGDSTGPHLHFEIRVNGVPVDPLEYNGSKEY